MASSLVKLMSRLCLSHQAGLPRSHLAAVIPVSSVLNTTCQQDRSYSVLQAQKRSLLLSDAQKDTNCVSRIQPPSPVGGLSIAVRSVTYEIKQWREHRVINRFYRLHWGGWIRTRGGRHRKLYHKSPRLRWLLKQHIFCNRTQSKRLDNLVLPHWKEPKHFVDSPYELYHKRTNFPDFPNHRKFYP